MELNYLREFVALSQSCQFQKTADELYISQSSLSKHIRAIEKELGHDLLKRSTRRVELTDFGKAFLPYAAQITELQQDYTNKLLRSESSHHIILGFVPVVTMYTVNRFLTAFTRLHPEYTFEIEENEEDILKAKLLKGELDFIILCHDREVTAEPFYVMPYRNDVLHVLSSDALPLAKKGIVTDEDLMDYATVKKGKTNFSRLVNPSLPPAAFTVSRSSLLVNLVSAGTAVAVLPYYVAHHYLKTNPTPGVTILPLTPEIRIFYQVFCLNTKKDSLFIRSLREFLDTDTAAGKAPASEELTVS